MDREKIDEARAVDEIEGRKPTAPQTTETSNAPAAGPHATEALTDHDATPGAGSLPDASPEVDGGAG